MKKVYQQPSIEVCIVNSPDIICGSGSQSASLNLSAEEEDKPQPGSGGYIWGD